MKPRLQRRVQRYGWDKAAPHYEDYWAAQLRPAHDRLMEMADLRRGDRVLDVACGTGLISFRAAEAVGSSGHVVATDISEAMVRHVTTEAETRGLEHVTAVRMDAEEGVQEEVPFDAALCGLGLMYAPDPEVALREMGRATRTDGRVVAAVWGARSNCGWAQIFPIVEERVESDVCPMFFQLGTGDTLRWTMEAAGLTCVATERISTTLVYDSPEDAIGAAFVGGPVAMAYARFDTDTREDAHAEYLESIEPFRNGPGYAIPGEFVVGAATV